MCYMSWVEILDSFVRFSEDHCASISEQTRAEGMISDDQLSNSRGVDHVNM